MFRNKTNKINKTTITSDYKCIDCNLRLLLSFCNLLITFLQPDEMYVWSKLEPTSPKSAYATPGRLSPSAWPPTKPASPAGSERELRDIIADLHDQRIQVYSEIIKLLEKYLM